MLRVLAVDLGAGSARVAEVDLDTTPPSLTVLHRYPHGPVRAPDGSLRWDWDRLVAEVETGLRAGLERGPVASIGVDTWGVDYGLLDSRGGLLSPPWSYRDDRTKGWREVAERIGSERLYGITGIQLMAVNTIYQLAVHDRDELASAERLLMLPELLVHALTGAVVGERTSAGTTQLVDVRTGGWSDELLEEVGVAAAIMPPIAEPATPVGSWEGIPVHLVGGHDTASAVVALPGPPAPGAAFVSSGTWTLVGAERPEADTSEAARRANFSNEPGALGGVRFLKNVMGLWMLERCREAWGDPPVEDLLGAAEEAGSGGPMVDATSERFLAPDDMEAEVRSAAGLPATAGRGAVVRCILDSLAAATAAVVAELDDFLDEPVSEVHVIGGGGRNDLLNRLTEEACRRPLRVGPAEATALGNALVQGIALGRFDDVSSARTALAGD